MTTARRGSVLLLALAAAASGALEARICEPAGVLTHLGTDSADRRLLFSIHSGASGTDPWLVQLRLESLGATLHPDALRGDRLGAFDGPGPFLSAFACGERCYQPLEWRGGGWQPLGDAVTAVRSGTVHLTRDRGGRGWLTVHAATDRPGVVEVEAWSEAAGSWQARGRLLVQAVGNPGARPDPQLDGAIVVGTGRFDREREPSYWLESLPRIPESAGGQLVGGGREALYLTHESVPFVSLDAGRTWRRVPWRPAGTDGLRAPELWSDLPLSLYRGVPSLVWFVDRRGTARDVRLTRRLRSEGWVEDGAIDRGPSAPMPLEHLIDLGRGRWLALGPCTDGDAGPGISVVEVDGGRSAPVRWIPFARGWER